MTKHIGLFRKWWHCINWLVRNWWDLYIFHFFLAPDPVQGLFEEPVQEPYEEPVQEPFEEPVHEPYEEPVHEPFGEPVNEPFEEPVNEPFEEPVEEPLKEKSSLKKKTSFNKKKSSSKKKNPEEGETTQVFGVTFVERILIVWCLLSKFFLFLEFCYCKIISIATLLCSSYYS